MLKKQLKKLNLNAINKKMVKYLKDIGQKLAYMVLLMVYSYKRKDTPNWAKHIVIGAVGYFISPFDSIPDLTPILGYTDDIGVLIFGLVTISAYVNDDVRIQARRQLKKYFGELDFETLEEVDAQL